MAASKNPDFKSQIADLKKRWINSVKTGVPLSQVVLCIDYGGNVCKGRLVSVDNSDDEIASFSIPKPVGLDRFIHYTLNVFNTAVAQAESLNLNIAGVVLSIPGRLVREKPKVSPDNVAKAIKEYHLNPYAPFLSAGAKWKVQTRQYIAPNSCPSLEIEDKVAGGTKRRDEFAGLNILKLISDFVPSKHIPIAFGNSGVFLARGLIKELQIPKDEKVLVLRAGQGLASSLRPRNSTRIHDTHLARVGLPKLEGKAEELLFAKAIEFNQQNYQNGYEGTKLIAAEDILSKKFLDNLVKQFINDNKQRVGERDDGFPMGGMLGSVETFEGLHQQLKSAGSNQVFKRYYLELAELIKAQGSYLAELIKLSKEGNLVSATGKSEWKAKEKDSLKELDKVIVGGRLSVLEFYNELVVNVAAKKLAGYGIEIPIVTIKQKIDASLPEAREELTRAAKELQTDLTGQMAQLLVDRKQLCTPNVFHAGIKTGIGADKVTW